MGIRITFDSHSYRAVNGQLITEVVLKHDGKTFMGRAFLHEDDTEYASEIFGGSLAENRARIKVYKYELKKLKTKKRNWTELIRKFEDRKESWGNESMYGLLTELSLLDNQIKETESIIREIEITTRALIRKNDEIHEKNKRLKEIISKNDKEG